MAELLSLKQIAQRLNIPVSTVSYYRNQFNDFMPAVNVGRYPKYNDEVLEVISEIRRLFGEGYDRQQIEDILKQQFAINQGEELATTTKGTTIQQSDKYLYLLEEYASLLQQQQATIAQQSELIKQLTEQFDREQRIKERLLLQELKNRENKEPARQSGLWQRIFKRKR